MFNYARWMERQVPYIKPDGEIMVKDYDGLIASGKSWTLGDGNQQVWLQDIKHLKESIPGYYFGNTGITSVSVRYINNEPIVRPATPSETFIKKRLHEHRDPKIQELATAQQIGDNLYNIFSKDTIFLGMGGEGLGWLQPGETVQIENTRQITITQAHFLLLSVIYDPKNDVHHEIIFSDNIITPREFKNDYDTSGQQIHTAILQSCENQADIPRYIHLQHQKNVADWGDAYAGGAWRTRILNVEVTDEPNACTLNANQFTLLTGSYIIHAIAVVREAGRNTTRLRNITDGTTTIVGLREYAIKEHINNNHSILMGKFTITDTKTFEYQIYSQDGDVGAIGGVVPEIPIYCDVQLWKVA